MEAAGTRALRRLIGLVAGLLLLAVLAGSASAAGVDSFSGRMVIAHGDSRNPLVPSTKVWYLQHGNHHYRMSGTYSAARIGQRVTVAGSLHGDTLSVSALQAAATPSAAISGSFSSLIMMVDWTTPDSRTPQQAVNQIESVDAPWFESTSYGAITGFTATATPWLQIAPIANCDFNTLASEAEAAATAAGYTPSAYDRELYYFPYTSDCSFGGLAYVPGRQTWYNGQFDTYTTTHELGHNWGLWHSHFDDCSDSGTGAKVTLGSNCTLQEYGDESDSMGSAYSGGEYNASQKNQLGWLDGGRSQSVVANGTYSLSPYELTTPGILQALHIAAPEGDFWLEYRRSVGPDSGLAAAQNGVQVHLTTPGNGSWLLDMQPNQDPSWQSDENDGATLLPGTSWTDPADAFTIRTNSVTTASAAITVTFHSSAAPGAPTSQFRTPAGMSKARKAAAPNSVSWGVGTCAPAATYTLQRSTDHKTPATVYTGSALTAVVNLPTGHTSTFSVSCGGPARSTTFRLNGAQETAATYSGKWAVSKAATAWGGTTRYSTAKHASAAYRCTCEAIALVTTQASNHGSAQIFVDGKLRATVNTHAAHTRNREVIYRYAWAANGVHTIRVVNLASAREPRISIDGFLTRTAS
jgi:hypothetical protein